MSDLYFDDFEAGQVFELGSRSISQDEIVAFAALYDPQPFHLDPEAAVKTVFGGIIASGWQTACIFMRFLVDGLLSRAASMGSPGLDDLRWLKPVRPSDVLRARAKALEARRSRSKPDRGTVSLHCAVSNQTGDDILTFTANVLFQTRETA